MGFSPEDYLIKRFRGHVDARQAGKAVCTVIAPARYR